MDRGVDGPLLPRPFVSFSLSRWEAWVVRDEGLCEEGEEEEDVRRTCVAESPRLRHGIFSRLTTGSDTLENSGKRVADNFFLQLMNKMWDFIGLSNNVIVLCTHQVLFRAPLGGYTASGALLKRE